MINTWKTCICLQYIGDNGPCPEHGDPPNGYIPPRMRVSHGAIGATNEKPKTPKSQTPAGIPAPNITSTQAGRRHDHTNQATQVDKGHPT